MLGAAELILVVFLLAQGAGPASLPADEIDAGDAGDPLLAPLPADAAAEQALLRELGPAFKLYEARHFVIAHDSDEKLVRELAGRLEVTYRGVVKTGRYNKFELAQPPARLHVIFFDGQETYIAYAKTRGFPAQGTFGFYSEKDNRSTFFNAAKDPTLWRLQQGLSAGERYIRETQRDAAANGADRDIRRALAEDRDRLRIIKRQIEERAEEINRTVVQHEAAHQMLFNFGIHRRGVSNPLWLAEGLATMFETPPGRYGQGAAVVNRWRLKDFHGAMRAGQLAPLRGFVAGRQGFLVRGATPDIGYAQAWALVHYLKRTKGDELTAYLKDIARRRPGQEIPPAEEIQLFEKHFGKLDERFTERWIAYIKSIR